LDEEIIIRNAAKDGCTQPVVIQKGLKTFRGFPVFDEILLVGGKHSRNG
jgi:hypothetical protein